MKPCLVHLKFLQNDTKLHSSSVIKPSENVTRSSLNYLNLDVMVPTMLKAALFGAFEISTKLYQTSLLFRDKAIGECHKIKLKLLQFGCGGANDVAGCRVWR
jgi:hypothetical protein